MLHHFAARIGVADVHLLGHVTNEELTAYYEVADVFLCASEHEGFCVPLIESFHKQRAGRGLRRHGRAGHDGRRRRAVRPQGPDRDCRARRCAGVERGTARGGARRGRTPRSPGCSRRTSTACCCGFVDEVLRGRGEPAPPVAFDFWDQVRQAESWLDEIRSVPSRGLPGAARRAGTGTGRAEAQRDDRQPVGAGRPQGRRHRRRARRVRGLLRAMGHESDLFALTIDDDLRDDVRPFADPEARRGDVTIFHYALPSPMTEAFATLPHGRVLQYHNVTPAHFFAPYHAGIFRLAPLGRQELATLAGRTDAGPRRLGIQPRRSSKHSGFDHTGVFPIAIDIERITSAPRRPALEKVLDDGLAELPVRRPHRAEQEDRGPHPAGRGVQALRRRQLPLHLRRPDRRRAALLQHDPGAGRRVPDAGRSVLVHRPGAGRRPGGLLPHAPASTSRCREHEGFCVPLLEAMAVDVPVLAYGVDRRARHARRRRRAVRTRKISSWPPNCSASSPTTTRLRAKVIAGQRRRLADFGDDRIREALTGLLHGQLAGLPGPAAHRDGVTS